ncbi:malignant T cell-amplified sequence 1 [Sphaeroforma arctica JP610]|uniref:Malignant T cell-amplified sequence 1 n=1 Tax=Sphaeroforma arctica JP610 TaxID=667725 RepID=A0A0L0G5H9_9EUKA|nr:malignant T cell-amplified sequence 1 [Sphaeroforma arctica JP610]KNC84285.1 malignant T cell-amplified sequence 1 [Sphaeroforma arctica JP610]|eukprot:XP_014158187.1 malignant T cell-amplified sequence 1 [Sphaeroforma arctica JP610]
MYLCRCLCGFTPKESISGQTQTKSSVARGIRQKVLDSYPMLEDEIESLFPKKQPLFLVKCHDRIQMIHSNGEPLFFNEHDGPWIPTLRLLHKYPDLLPHEQVDKGAIRFVLSGAHIMCPGLTSPGAKMSPAEKETVVAIMGEGKTHAMAIGRMKMSSEDIQSKNKGIGVDNMHYLQDGLWQTKTLT